ncbi:MAG: transglutaminase [Flavobacteriaceae bacterium]|nr:transglutaminase [Flavobacteriaceae bacterium]
MKQLWLFFFFFIISIHAQQFTAVDAIVRDYPKFNNVINLANQITTDFETDTEKVRAVFIWLTANIRYDLEEYYNPKTKRIRFSYTTEKERIEKLVGIKNQIVKETFETKKAICEGYAQSFKKICDLLHLESKTIKGNVRNTISEIGVFSGATNHAWNAVKIDNNWFLIDATWASGYAINNQWKKHFNDAYFYPKPATFIRSHFPENNSWQLLQRPYSKKEYTNQPIFGEAFLNTNYQLISPKNGIVNDAKNSEIVVKIANLKPSDRISFTFIGRYRNGQSYNGV